MEIKLIDKSIFIIVECPFLCRKLCKKKKTVREELGESQPRGRNPIKIQFDGKDVEKYKNFELFSFFMITL